MELIDSKIITRTEKTFRGPGEGSVDWSQDDPVIRYAPHLVRRDGATGQELSREVLPGDAIRLSELVKLDPAA